MIFKGPKRIWDGAFRRFAETRTELSDRFRTSVIEVFSQWPCRKPQVLVVGCESSGTTILSHMLHGGCNGRFLKESRDRWVWRAYMDIYQGRKNVRDFPRLQLFDFVKVPGIAAILPGYREEFPNCRAIYVVRDPRDVLASAIRTFKVQERRKLDRINWIRQDWLGIQDSDPVTRMAIRWSQYLSTCENVGGTIFIRYEDFCQDKVGTCRQLCERLELKFNENFARENSEKQASHESTRNYTPVGPGSWSNKKLITEQDYNTIQRVCGEQMKKWGYA